MKFMDRRSAVASILASATCAAAGFQLGRAYSSNRSEQEEIKFAENEILMLVYPRFTSLDLIGPQHVFALLGPGYKTRLVWKEKKPIVSDTGVSIVPSMTFNECPDKPAIIFVPGGTDGTLAAIEDKEVRYFLAQIGGRAQYVTSVCTGSLVLGASGLLKGYRATTHWLALRALEKFGAQPVQERVVIDRNRVTGAGVTAGIDFALKLTELLHDESYAKSVQLMMEYDPQPPFDSGNPQVADSQSVKLLEAMAGPFLDEVDAAVTRLGLQP